MTPKEAFYQQFPKGCPSCSGPKRYITFTDLVKRPKGLLNIHPALAGVGMATSESSHFAECEACHEAFVWLKDSETWVNANQVRKGGTKKARTGKSSDKDRGRDSVIDIGKLY